MVKSPFSATGSDTGTSGYGRKLEIPDLISRSDNDSFEVHEVWLNRHFK